MVPYSRRAKRPRPLYTGNDPRDPKSGYGNADFDRTHVGVVNYTYQLPKFTAHSGWRGALANGWMVSGQTILQSGLPYCVYDYSGSVASQ